MEATLSHDLYQKNVERWALFCPEAAALLKDCDETKLSFCETEQHELNLKKESNGSKVYYHAQSGALKEAQDWFASLALKGSQVICVYGVGLGYCFEACKKWLAESYEHQLFFIDDDLRVIKRLLETPLGTEIVNHRQVWLFQVNLEDVKGLNIVAGHFIMRRYLFSALPFYQTHRKMQTNETRIWINYGKIQLDALLSEFISMDGGYFKNFYKNIYLLPESYFGNALFGKFEGIPAIICGAGPSLAKNFDVLKTLKNQALIFAGSTALNVLNAGGLQPHIAVGIDPNPPQFERFLNNKAYLTPFFYRNRINNDALRVVHGDKLYINGSTGYHIGQWFESKLGINEKPIQEGHNVINFSVSLASQLGCNPIILVGMDLAYTDAQSYAFELVPHAIQDPKEAYKTKYHKETLISKKDIFGNPIYTLEKWILESHWLTQFAVEHPKIKMINATEGGLGFIGVPNIALADVSSKQLTKHYDLDGLVHNAIQSAQLPSETNYENLKAIFNQLENSLNKCLDYCIKLAKDYKLLAQGNKEALNSIEETLNLLQKEEAFIHILNTYDTAFMHYHNAFLTRCKIENEPEEKTAPLMNHRYGILQQIIRTNLTLLKQANEMFQNLHSVSLEEPAETEKVVIKPAHEALPNDIKADSQKLFHLNGSLKGECYLTNGKLDGPSFYYDEKGKLLAQAYFKNGLKEGEEYRWYASGEIYSLQRYHQNQEDGRQEFYYENNVQRALLHYNHGLLDGESTLYYPNGKPKRQLHYKQGKRHGQELYWNEAGVLTIACEYAEDKPVGIVKKWYDNGNLALEINYENPANPVIKRWTDSGIPIAQDKLREDYFDKVTKETGILNDSFAKILEGIRNLAPLADKIQQEELSKIEKTILHMQNLYKEMQKESGGLASLSKEAIWKTQSSENQVKDYLHEVTQKMQQDIMHIQKTIQEMTKRLINIRSESENLKNDK